MAQVTDHITLRNAKVELSLDGSTWIDISGEANSVEPAGGKRKIAELEPVLSSRPVLFVGQAEAVDLKIKVVWREAPAAASAALYLAYEQRTPVFLRYAPKGVGASIRYRTGPAFVVRQPLPGGTVDDGRPLLVEIQLKAEYVTTEVL